MGTFSHAGSGASGLWIWGGGGEFPVAAASASERAESTEDLYGKRGQTVVLVCSMQVGYLTLLLLQKT